MIADIKKSAEEKMKKTLETLKNDLGKIRTGRAHTGLLDHVMVDYYGTPTPINGVANVTLLDARTLAVTPWEKKMVRPSTRRSAIPISASIPRPWAKPCACLCRR